MNKYYVYIHRRASDNKPFYVGKGSGPRAWHFLNRNNYWHNVKNKHGVIVEIVFDNLSEEDSLRLEKDTILEFRYFGFPLTNLSSGGESPVVSAETRRKMSEAHKGTKRTRDSVERTAASHRGRKRTAETCRRISEALKGKKVPPERALRSALNKTGMKSKVADKTKYIFVKEDGTEFIGTRMELCEKYLISKKLIGNLFGKNPGKSSQGWTVKGIVNDTN